MFFRFFTITVLLLICIPIQAQTIIFPGTKVSGHWAKENAPYQILGEVIIPEGEILTIDKGVEVQFQTWDGNTRLGESQAGWMRVQGQLVAEGTEKDRIVFTRIGNNDSWGLLFFDSLSEANVLEHCVIQFAGIIDGIRGEYQTFAGVSAFKSDVTIKNCILTSNRSYGLVCGIGSNVYVQNCLIAGNFGAGIGCFDAGPHIEKTTVVDNIGAGIYGQRDAEPVLKRCVMVGNPVSIDAEAAILEKCVLDVRPLGQLVRLEDCQLVLPAPANLQWIMGNNVLKALTEWAEKGMGCSWLRDANSRGRVSVYLGAY
jgi:hypothetical protein